MYYTLHVEHMGILSDYCNMPKAICIYNHTLKAH